MVIRPFERPDMEETLRVFRASCELSHPFLQLAFIEKTEQRLRKRSLEASQTDVVDEGGIRAFVCRKGGLVEALFVDPPFQGQGIGKRLLDHLKSELPVICLSVFGRNARAIAFYQREEFWAVKVNEHRETGETTVLLKWTFHSGRE
jgi:putative acetyltransferase